jgi:hypothetical protein
MMENLEKCNEIKVSKPKIKSIDSKWDRFIQNMADRDKS